MTNLTDIQSRFKALEWTLDERLRRLLAAAESLALGYGGVTAVARATGVSRRAIHAGLEELRNHDCHQPVATHRIRRPGGGRKRTIEKDPELCVDLERLVNPMTRGAPVSPLRWTCKSVRRLTEKLRAKGHVTSHRMVAELLRELNYSLQANSKTIEGSEHPDRNAQFEYINREVEKHLACGNPAISVDTKKKELVGQFKNAGQEWQPKGQPEEVNDHDFMDHDLGRAAPYGVYDIGANTGWVSVGTDHDTAVFAVETIRRWWLSMGSPMYPRATELLITADGGGSNGSRLRLWKLELQKLSNEINLPIAVCHFPPGTSKWNKIEHRMFSFISQNWRGKPLTSHEVLVSLIASTTTANGLAIHAEVDHGTYPSGQKVTTDEMSTLSIEKSSFHGDWNYTIKPNAV